MKFLRLLPFTVAALVALAGCSTALSTRKAVDLAPFRRVYVETRLADNHRLDAQIAAALNALGYEATFGFATMRPPGVNAIVSYTDRWEWDFKDYMIEFRVEVRDARNDKPLGTGSYYQASLKTKPSAEVVRLVIEPLFKK